jgi:hypothetical protein
MIRMVPFAAWLALLVYGLIDLDRADPRTVRRLPLAWWYVIVVCLPIAGAAWWLIAGRPDSPARSHPTAWRPFVRGAVPWSSQGTRARSGAAPRARSDDSAAGPQPAGPRPVGPQPVGPQTAADAIDRRLRAELERIDREFDEAVQRSRAHPPGNSETPVDGDRGPTAAG